MTRTPAPTLPMTFKFLKQGEGSWVFVQYGPHVQRYLLFGNRVRVSNDMERDISVAAKDISETEFINILARNSLSTTIEHETKRVKRKHKLKVQEVESHVEDMVEKTVASIVKKIEKFYEEIEASQSEMLRLTGQMYDVEGQLGSAKLRHLLDKGETLTPIIDFLSDQIKGLNREHYT